MVVVVEGWRILIGLEAGLPEGLLLLLLFVGADVILRLLRKNGEREEEVLELGGGVEVGGVGVDLVAPEEEGPLLDLPLTLFEFPNQRLRRVLDESSSVAVVLDCCSFSRACVRFDVGDSASSECEAISTSSASRYHFLRRVYRSQPSWPRRPSFHLFQLVQSTTRFVSIWKEGSTLLS